MMLWMYRLRILPLVFIQAIAKENKTKPEKFENLIAYLKTDLFFEKIVCC